MDRQSILGSMVKELTLKDLQLNFDKALASDWQSITTEESIIGQLRAWKALTMGTEIQARGYNIFVSGSYGTGRTTAVKKILASAAEDTDNLKDILLVFNFRKPENPQVLYPPPGEGQKLKKSLHQLIEELKKGIPLCLSEDSYKSQRDHMISQQEQYENTTLHNFDVQLKQAGFQIVQVKEEDSNATDLAPLYKGKPTPFEELQELVNQGKLSREAWNETRESYYRFMDEMKNLFSRLKQEREVLDRDLQKLSVETVQTYVEEKVRQATQSFDFSGLSGYIEGYTQDILNHIYLFTNDDPQEDDYGNPPLIRYGVHILMDHSLSKKAPVIFENHPTSQNLFGTIETRTDKNGETRTNFMMIRGGSLIQASGGFLVIRADEIFEEEGSWMGLKRALQTGFVEIQMPQNPFAQSGPLLKPEPIAIRVKVIIIGSEHFYDLIYNTDQDVKKLFKISAEFDSSMPRNRETTGQFLHFLQSTIEDKKLLPFTDEGRMALLEQGVRLAEDRHKLTTRFSMMNDLLKETSYWAQKEGKPHCSREDVEKAVEEKRNLFSLMEEKLDKQIADGTILLDVVGEKIGQVNGLAVLDRGYYNFGRPMRISAEAGPGMEGLVNIEREAGLSGEIHDKGILILESFLRSYMAEDFPLALWGGICFDQSYNMVDGDSASSTEAYALLSAISKIPLRQDLAVTGSINQKGEIQPIGGATEKIEGFFDVCSLTGLTGTQGVIIPAQNVKNVILRTPVLQAIEEGTFHIYPIDHLSQGLEILTGKPYGHLREVTRKRLKTFWEVSRKRG